MKSILATLVFLSLSFTIHSQCISGDCKNGKGVYKWKDGDKYDGGWKDGKFHGKGTYFYSNGSTFLGMYKQGKKHGEGVYIDAKGKHFEGFWELGKRILKTNTILSNSGFFSVSALSKRISFLQA